MAKFDYFNDPTSNFSNSLNDLSLPAPSSIEGDTITYPG